MTIELCHCGRPLHYSDRSIEIMVRNLIQMAGDEYIDVTTPQGVWRVQRHYIALHGLRPAELPALGFERLR